MLFDIIHTLPWSTISCSCMNVSVFVNNSLFFNVNADDCKILRRALGFFSPPLFLYSCFRFSQAFNSHLGEIKKQVFKVGRLPHIDSSLQSLLSTKELSLTATMYSAILPWCMDFAILVMTIICIEAGHKPGFNDQYPIISIDTSPLRIAYEAKYGNTSAIHDVYKIHMKTFCSGDYPLVAGDPLVNLTCTAPSTYC